MMSSDSKDLIVVEQHNGTKCYENEKESYRFFNYIKEKPAVGIAIGSSFIAVGTALLNIFAYLLNKKYLSFWNVSEDFIKFNSMKTVYFLVALFFSCLFAFILDAWLNEVCKNHLKITSPLLGLDLKLKNFKTKTKSLASQLGKNSSLLKKFKPKSEDGLKQKKLLENEIDKSKNEIKNIKKDANKTKKSIRKLKNLCLLKLFFAIFFMSIVQTVVIFVCMWAAFPLIKNAFLVSFVFSITMVTTFCIVKYSYFRRKAIKIIGANRNDNNHFENENVGPIKKFFSDKSLENILIYVAIVLLVTIFMSYFYSSMSLKDKKEFYIYEENGSEYVYVYENDDYMIFEKVEIDEKNDTITIYTTEQKFLLKTNFTFELKEFKIINYLK